VALKEKRVALTFTDRGDFFGASVNEVSIALCAGGLGRVFAVTSSGFQVRYHLWDLGATGFSPVLDKQSADGGAGLATAFTAEDRLLAAFNGSGKTHFRAFDDSLNAKPSLDVVDLSPSYNSVALAGIPPANHLLWPGGAIMALQHATDQPGTLTGTTPKLPKTLTANTTVSTTIGPKIAYAAAAAVTQDHKLHAAVWSMDWNGQLPTKLSKLNVATSVSAIRASAATISAAWEEQHLKKSDFVTAVQTASPSGPLKLLRWRRDSTASPATLTKLSEVTATESVKDVAVAPIHAGASPGVATAVIDSAGNLKVIGWRAGIDGSISRGSDATGEAAMIVRCAWVRDRDIVTAVKLTGGDLKLVYWRFPDQGAAIRLGELGVHAIGSALSIAHRPGTGSDLGETIVATNLENHTLKLLRFGVTES
jgi:hypothetical protein